MMRKLGIAVLTAVLVVAAGEVTARLVMSRVHFAHSYDTPRNPNNRRAWPAYTAPRPREADQRLIIIISNSQGYAPEIDDAQLIYPALLKKLLDEHDPSHDYIVANWSVGGASGPEMVLLAARAVDHDPDLLMVVTHSNPFADARIDEPLSYYISDTNQLAYDPVIRGRMPDRFLRDHRAYDPTNFLQAYSGLVNVRDAFVEQRHEQWNVSDRGELEPRPINPRNLQGAPVMRGRGEQMVEWIVGVFHADRPDTPVLFVSMPLCEPRWKPQAWRRIVQFGPRIAARLADKPNVTVLDAVEVVDPDLFITNKHMLPTGHEQFARWLSPHLVEQLRENDE